MYYAVRYICIVSVGFDHRPHKKFVVMKGSDDNATAIEQAKERYVRENGKILNIFRLDDSSQIYSNEETSKK